MAFHISRGARVRLAVGTMKCEVACFSITNDTISSEWTKKLENIEPGSLHFASGGRDLLIFGTFDGGVYVLSRSSAITA